MLTTGVGGSQKYHAYGATRSSGTVQTKYQFTGQEADSGTGLVYMKARYYDPVIGQFISPDTIVPDPTNVYAYNRYMYAYGNPLRYSDPSGHSAASIQRDPYGGGGIGPAVMVAGGTAAFAVGVALCVNEADTTPAAPPPSTAARPLEPLPGFATEDAGSSPILDTPLEEGSLVGVVGVRVGPELPSQNVESFPLWPHSIYDNVYFASALRRNMEATYRREGKEIPQAWVAHHIVAANDRQAAEARAILRQAGIDINSPENGVFLPPNTSVANPQGATLHEPMHTRAYYEMLTERLLAAGPEGALDVLNQVREELLTGNSPR